MPGLKMTTIIQYDPIRDRYRRVRKFPAAVRAHTGTMFTHSWPKGIKPTVAMIHEVDALYYARLADAPVTMLLNLSAKHEVDGPRSAIDARASMRALTVTMRRMTGQIELRQLADEHGIAITIPEPAKPKHERITLSQALIDWETRHGSFRNDRARQKALTAKTTATESLLASAKTDDLGALDDARVILDWVDSMKDEPRRQYDSVVHVKGLFAALAARQRFGDRPNIMDRIETPTRPKGEVGDPFIEDDQRRIIASAIASDDPELLWGHVLPCFLGVIASELVEADASDFKMASQIRGRGARSVRPEDDRLCFDMQDRHLKTPWRPRWIPLHDTPLALGLRDYLEARKGKKLFDLTSDQFSEKMAAHLKSLGIDQRHYSWRHTFTTRLDDMDVGGTTQRILTGHAAPDVHERNYIKKSLAKRVEAIAVLFDPTA
jgi:hypothetical protein